MRFANPSILVLLWALPLFWLALWWLVRRRQKRMELLIQKGLVDQVTAHYSKSRLLWKNLYLVLAFFFMLLAISRPQWGYVLEKVKQQGLDIILAVDVSKSMMTQDVKPNRLERTKLAIKDLLKKVNGDRLGLMAFAGEGFMTCPLTVDYNGFAASVDDLTIDTIPAGGTNIEKLIKEALRTFGSEQLKYKALVILTDGEQEQGNAMSAAMEAKQKGVRIFTIGIGTKEGDLIQVPQEDGSMGFLKDSQGNVVKSHLNEELLSRIAYESSGVYVRSSGAEFGLDYLYTHELSQWAKRDFEEKMQKKYYERFQWPLALGVFFLILSI